MYQSPPPSPSRPSRAADAIITLNSLVAACFLIGEVFPRRVCESLPCREALHPAAYVGIALGLLTVGITLRLRRRVPAVVRVAGAGFPLLLIVQFLLI